jgi:hypothetical protein
MLGEPTHAKLNWPLIYVFDCVDISTYIVLIHVDLPTTTYAKQCQLCTNNLNNNQHLWIECESRQIGK